MIGGSAGGLKALSRVLATLPPDFPSPLLVVLHLSPDSGGRLPLILAGRCALPVKESDDKEPIQGGRVYLAPPNYHLLVELDRTLSLNTDERVCYARPAIDVLFESAAEAFGSALIGVLLSGANHDGTAGLRQIMALGGTTVVQDPITAESSQMPGAAVDAGVAEHVFPLTEIGPYLVRETLRDTGGKGS